MKLKIRDKGCECYHAYERKKNKTDDSEFLLGQKTGTFCFFPCFSNKVYPVPPHYLSLTHKHERCLYECWILATCTDAQSSVKGYCGHYVRELFDGTHFSEKWKLWVITMTMFVDFIRRSLGITWSSVYAWNGFLESYIPQQLKTHACSFQMIDEQMTCDELAFHPECIPASAPSLPRKGSRSTATSDQNKVVSENENELEFDCHLRQEISTLLKTETPGSLITPTWV